jgi:hypothetical protein
MDNLSVLPTPPGEPPAPQPEVSSPGGRRAEHGDAPARADDSPGPVSSGPDATVPLPRQSPDARRALRRAPPAATARGPVEEWLHVRLGLALGTPGLGGRIFLITMGGLVTLIALGSVVLGNYGGPAELRPLGDQHSPGPTPVPAAAPAARPPAPLPPAVLPGVPIAATRTYQLTSYAPGAGHPTELAPAAGTVTVGRQSRHVPRRSDDHLLAAELVFPLLPAPARCVAQVELRITLVASQGSPGSEAPYPLAAYPSALTGLASGAIPTPVPRLDLVANRPRGDVDWNPAELPAPADGPAGPGQLPAGQELSADITELYQHWAAGMPSDHGGPAIQPGTPLVLALRPARTEVLGTWQHVYGGGDSRTPPVLAWTRRAHCS